MVPLSNKITVFFLFDYKCFSKSTIIISGVMEFIILIYLLAYVKKSLVIFLGFPIILDKKLIFVYPNKYLNQFFVVILKHISHIFFKRKILINKWVFRFLPYYYYLLLRFINFTCFGISWVYSLISFSPIIVIWSSSMILLIISIIL